MKDMKGMKLEARFVRRNIQKDRDLAKPVGAIESEKEKKKVNNN